MRKLPAIPIVATAIALLVPIAVMLNCSGWNEGSGMVTACVIDGPLFRSAADFTYGFVVISAFLGFIPVILYLAAVALVSAGIAHIIGKVRGTGTRR